jgi:NADH-quinone oxidoreductase subunit M
MHNRQGPTVTSFDMSLRDAIVLVPLVLAIVAFAVFPQRALDAGEPAVRSATRAVVQPSGGTASNLAAPNLAAQTP